MIVKNSYTDFINQLTQKSNLQKWYSAKKDFLVNISLNKNQTEPRFVHHIDKLADFFTKNFELLKI